MGSLEYRNRWELSWRVQKMYPPFLGMLWALLMEFGRTSQWLVTRWAVGLSGLMVLSFTALAKRVSWKLGASRVFFLASSSFVLYQLFWWGYLKQMLGVMMIVTVIHLLSLPKWTLHYVLVWLLLAVGWLTQRPALVLGGVVGMLWLVSGLRTSRKTLIGAVVALWVLASVWWYFRDIQIAPMIEPFFRAIDIPVLNDWYKAWGTFLTMLQRLQTDIVVIGSGLVGWWFLIQHKAWNRSTKRLFVVWLILMVWVGIQLSFYQRMIWYLGPILIVWSGYAIVQLPKKYRWWVIGLLIGVQYLISGLVVNRTRPPIINPVEYAMIQEIPDLVEDDAIIMVSWIRYSPWVRGRSWREVIAPGLFDYTQRWNQAQWRSTQRIDVNGDTKCDTARETFGYLNRPLYAWVWITQEAERMNGYCMSRVLDHPRLSSALYRLSYDD
jgi:hypothetical protein